MLLVPDAARTREKAMQVKTWQIFDERPYCEEHVSFNQ